MSRRPHARTALLVLLMAGGLSACGKVGSLERPGPLFGQGRNTTRDADRNQQQVQDPTRPVDTLDPRDRTTDPAPPRTLPIEGTSPTASDPGPQGALPNPYADPRR